MRSLVAATCEYCGRAFETFPYLRAKGYGRWCSRSCRAKAQFPATTLAERFWSKVDKNGPVPEHRPDLGPCWLWTASRRGNGYGQLAATRHGDPPLKAHRVSWELHNDGAVPAGFDVCHHCDNRACVRPGHLFLGTRLQNMRDARSKGRRLGRPRADALQVARDLTR